MPLSSKTRFPLRPLLDAAGGPEPLAHALGYDGVRDMGQHTNIGRWCRTGLSMIQADRFACAINLHPSMIWPTLWWVGTEGAS